MKLSSKITVAAVAAIVVTVAVGLFILKRTIEHQGEEMLRGTMHSTLVEAENVRESISKLGAGGAFDRPKLLEEFRKTGDLRGSTLYKTIPVVAAWDAAGKAAAEQGFDFRVPKHQARNKKNLPTPEEAEILKELEKGGKEEFFQADRSTNSIILARPIRLTSDCLFCHGDPANSPTKDGKDILGFPMENWREGELHGAFVLKTDFSRVDAQVTKGMTQSVLWLGLVAIAIIGGFIVMNQRIIVRPLRTAADSLATASDQIASAASQIARSGQSLAEGASEQAASLEETSASLEEISSMTKRNAESAVEAKNLSNQTRSAAEIGAGDVEELNNAMDAIKTSSDNIAKIIKTIDEIAFQTNILALNAAVEAARAGEAGAGFAVVADEVRSLAQRSAQAAKETAEKIEDSIAKSENGVRISVKVGGSLQEIVAKARKVDALVAEIATASNEQNQGIGQVTTAVSQMDKVTQSNAAGAEEAASASEELSAQTEMMRDSIGVLSNLVGTASGHRQKRASEPELSKGKAGKSQKPKSLKPVGVDSSSTAASAADSKRHEAFFN